MNPKKEYEVRYYVDSKEMCLETDESDGVIILSRFTYRMMKSVSGLDPRTLNDNLWKFLKKKLKIPVTSTCVVCRDTRTSVRTTNRLPWSKWR